MNKRMNMYQK